MSDAFQLYACAAMTWLTLIVSFTLYSLECSRLSMVSDSTKLCEIFAQTPFLACLVHLLAVCPPFALVLLFQLELHAVVFTFSRFALSLLRRSQQLGVASAGHRRDRGP